MLPERDLSTLLRGLRPVRRDGRFVFVLADPPESRPDAHATIREDEGTTVVLPQAVADRDGLAYDFVAAWITLRVRSALDAVGLTAVVSGALADAGISANVLAGLHHDHLLVPADRADEALEVLGGLAEGERA